MPSSRKSNSVKSYRHWIKIGLPGRVRIIRKNEINGSEYKRKLLDKSIELESFAELETFRTMDVEEAIKDYFEELCVGKRHIRELLYLMKLELLKNFYFSPNVSKVNIDGWRKQK